MKKSIGLIDMQFSILMEIYENTMLKVVKR